MIEVDYYKTTEGRLPGREFIDSRMFRSKVEIVRRLLEVRSCAALIDLEPLFDRLGPYLILRVSRDNVILQCVDPSKLLILNGLVSKLKLSENELVEVMSYQFPARLFQVQGIGNAK